MTYLWFKINIYRLYSGEEEGRQGGASSADPSRRRNSGQLINAGSLSKQKSPVAHDSTSKDAVVSGDKSFLTVD